VSHPAIGIGHPVSAPPPPSPARGPCPARPGAPSQPLDLMVRYSGFSICHTEFGIRNSRIGNREIRNHGAVEQANPSGPVLSGDTPRSAVFTPSSHQTRS